VRSRIRENFGGEIVGDLAQPRRCMVVVETRVPGGKSSFMALSLWTPPNNSADGETETGVEGVARRV
jgi:hypothetical protein